MKSFSKLVIVPFLFFGCLLALQKDAFAVFTLSVTPTREVRSIHFDQTKPGSYSRNEEVTISVNTTLATQYMIYQEINQPLTNELGKTIPQGAFIVFSPSSPLGTLKTQLETPVTMGQIPVYTSNAAGDTDSFVLVYNVNIPLDQPGGQYRTQIRFTAQPVNAQAGVSQSTVILDVIVDLRSAFHVNIQNTRGSRELDLGSISKDRLVARDTLKVDIGSNSAPYTISQQLAETLTSQEGETIDDGEFKFIASGGEKGTLAGKGSEIPVPLVAQKLYGSDSGAGDAIVLQYTASPELTQKAGIYRGTLTFKTESSGSQSTPIEPINIPVKIEVETIFYLDIDMPEITKVSFGVFKTSGEKHDKKVTLTAHNNTAQPYQVVQVVSHKMMNERGEELPPENFTYFGGQAQTGKLSTLAPLPVKEGQTVVFTSDNKGTPEKFVLEYELKTPRSPKKGSYATDISYSITSL